MKIVFLVLVLFLQTGVAVTVDQFDCRATHQKGAQAPHSTTFVKLAGVRIPLKTTSPQLSLTESTVDFFTDQNDFKGSFQVVYRHATKLDEHGTLVAAQYSCVTHDLKFKNQSDDQLPVLECLEPSSDPFGNPTNWYRVPVVDGIAVLNPKDIKYSGFSSDNDKEHIVIGCQYVDTVK